VTEIIKAFQASQLRYVDTASNPADVASRGSTVHVFLNNKTWTSCPAFLLLHESKWPANLRELEKLEVNDTEVKESIEELKTLYSSKKRMMCFHVSSITFLIGSV